MASLFIKNAGAIVTCDDNDSVVGTWKYVNLRWCDYLHRE